MANTTTTKIINLSILDKTLGGYGLTANHDDLLNTKIYVCDGSPVTQEQLENAVKAYDPNKEQTQEQLLATAKAALLAKLGITADEAALLLA